MTPISSSPVRRDTFRRTFITTVVVLSLLCAGFVALDIVTGPKLERVQVDTAQVVRQGDQQVRFFSSEQLGDASSARLSIVPDVDASVSVSGQVLAVQFARPLDYDTEYTVTVEGITNTADEQEATFTTSFQTDDPPIYLLDRDPGGDTIQRTTVGSTERTVVFTATGIEDFVLVGSVLAVTTVTDDGSSALQLVSLDDGKTEQLPLPVAGVVSQLAATPFGSTIGFALTSTDDPYAPEVNSVLYTLDLSGDRSFAMVPSLTGEPLEVQGWAFVPGATTLVAQDLDSDVALFDLADPASVTPLGHFSDFDGLSTDGSAALVTNQLGPVRLDLADLSQVAITPSVVDAFGGDVTLLRDGKRTQVIAVTEGTTGVFESYIVRDDGTTAEKIYETVDQKGRIIGSTPSPNDQYLAIEVEPNAADSVTDGYPVNPRSTTITTVIVEIATGAVVRSLEGFAIDW